MRSINMKRVLLGGLLAGLIINIGESILNIPLMGAQLEAATTALGLEPVGGAAIGIMMTAVFFLGIAGVWLYAAMRPRFGAGPRTALLAGLAVWFFAALYPSIGFIAMGLFPTSLVLVGIAWTFVEMPLAVMAGSWVYREERETAPEPAAERVVA